MTTFFVWYLLISVIGWISFPIIFRFFPALQDRGYTLSRTFGWLIWGYFFWLLASLGVLRNDVGGLLFCLSVLVALSVWSLKSGKFDQIKFWVSQNLRLVIVVEILFFVSFALISIVRASNPSALGTEKPMELAFINAILRSPTFPPHDPWLSGYAISYYYLGYVLVAMLAKLTGTSGGIAFNLGISMVFALTALGAYGLVYSLISVFGGKIRRFNETRKKIWVSFFGPFFILCVSNLEGFLEVLHSRGFFWKISKSGEMVSSFWKWLDMQELSLPPSQPLSWMPSRFYWWWRASRVVQDYDFSMNPKEVIDEFPVFSFILGDLHPHLLAMPFAFLAIALALNLFWGGSRGGIRRGRLFISKRFIAWVTLLLLAGGLGMFLLGASLLNLVLSFFGILTLFMAVVTFLLIKSDLSRNGLIKTLKVNTGDKLFRLPVFINTPTLIIGGLILGGLAFLNTWDFPFYVALLAGAFILRKLKGNLPAEGDISVGRSIKEFFSVAVLFGVVGVFLYLPFYIGFSSQAGGLLPNLIYPTRGTHLWVMFAPLLLPLLAYLIFLWIQDYKSEPLIKGLKISLGIIIFLWITSLLLGWGISVIPKIGDFYLGSLAAPDWHSLMNMSLNLRLTNAGGWLTLLITLTLTLGLLVKLFSRWQDNVEMEKTHDEVNKAQPDSIGQTRVDKSPHPFALLLILLGTILVLGPEFFYLRDQFGWRINTIFKFYYQAWLLWGIAAAFGVGVLLYKLRNLGAGLLRGAFVVLFGLSLTYTVLGFWTKTNGFKPEYGWTLDSTAYLERQYPHEKAAIEWLEGAPYGVVAEAVSPTGGSYTRYARVSTLSGLPSVLGWVGHESQWRGGADQIGSRQSDLEGLYCTRDWNEAKAIIDKYDIRYVYVGDLEMETYTPHQGGCPTGLSEAKFTRYLDLVFERGNQRVYQVPQF